MGKKLYVGNLPFSTTEAALSEMFTQIGSVDSVRLITDRDSGRSKGFGFVEMTNEEDAKSAITSYDGTQMEGRQIVVNEARPMEPREGGFRGARPSRATGWSDSSAKDGFNGGNGRRGY